MSSAWTVEIQNSDATWLTLTHATMEKDEAERRLADAKRVAPCVRIREWRALEPGEQVISKEEAEALLWWLDWTKEHTSQLSDSTAEMARSGEIEKTAGAGWVNRVVQVSNLELKLKGKQDE